MVKTANTGLERKRLECLNAYAVLNTSPEESLDGVAKIAAEICNAPIAVVSFVGEDKQYFKARHGVDITETPVEHSFCAMAIKSPHSIMTVPDARKDPRFADNPMVTKPNGVVAYAGVPLISSSGYPLGTLCVVDTRVRKFNRRQLTMLQTLAKQVMQHLESEKRINDLEKAQVDMEKAYQNLSKFSYAVSHDLKAPLIGIKALAEMIKEKHAGQLDPEGNSCLDLMAERAGNLQELISSILKVARLRHVKDSDKETFQLEELIEEVLVLIAPPSEVKIQLPSKMGLIHTYRYGLFTILLNLLTNAIKYNDKAHPIVLFRFEEDDSHFHISVEDNGRGIPKEHRREIFRNFKTLGHKDRYNKEGTGIGLALVKELVEKMGGSIQLQSEVGKGSKFEVSLPR